jgi:hypothetical protein
MPTSSQSEPPPARRWLTVEGDCSPAIAAVLEEELRAWAGTWRVEMDAGLLTPPFVISWRRKD